MDPQRKRVTILGSTGSIGTSTLDVLARHPSQFEVFALTAGSQVDVLLKQILACQPKFAVMADTASGQHLQMLCKDLGLATRVSGGSLAIAQVAAHEQSDIVMAAIVGAAGLAPCLAAARAGKRLLLANKEALVVGGEVFLAAVQQGGATLLPIDSEHSAIFQSLPEDPATWPARIDKIILTASGGPFRTMDPANLKNVTPEQACAHPNWVMGRKISVDSATMMNKTLEVIEAKYLFGVRADQLTVVLHPQSVIHSMVQYKDNSVVAQLGTPDMRGPIAYGLAWPERMACGADALDFATMGALTFDTFDAPAHRKRYPGLSLAWQVLEDGNGRAAVLNAANEVAVQAFLDGQIRFDQIHHVNLETLEKVNLPLPVSLEDLLELDRLTRAVSQRLVAKLGK